MKKNTKRASGISGVTQNESVHSMAVRIGGPALLSCEAHMRLHKCTLRQAVEALVMMLPLYPDAPVTVKVSKKVKGGKS